MTASYIVFPTDTNHFRLVLNKKEVLLQPIETVAGFQYLYSKACKY